MLTSSDQHHSVCDCPLYLHQGNQTRDAVVQGRIEGDLLPTRHPSSCGLPSSMFKTHHGLDIKAQGPPIFLIHGPLLDLPYYEGEVSLGQGPIAPIYCLEATQCFPTNVLVGPTVSGQGQFCMHSSSQGQNQVLGPSTGHAKGPNNLFRRFKLPRTPDTPSNGGRNLRESSAPLSF